MSGSFVQLVADDLTGALDTAAPFAEADRPVRLLLAAPGPQNVAALGGVAVSSESRDLAGDAATIALDRAIARVRRAGVPSTMPVVRFAKVDSVLRGRPIAETIQRMQRWAADCCLFAPAFPAMGRRTVHGRHQRRVDGVWQPAAIDDIVAAFAAAGQACRRREAGQAWCDAAPGIIVADAWHSEHLFDHARAFAGRADMLWAGSRGLAEAMTGAVGRRVVPKVTLLVVGTTHDVTRRQLSAAQASGLFIGRCVIDPVPGACTARATQRGIAAALADETAHDDEAALMVIGGDTLATVLDRVSAAFLDCIGEVAPGVALSRIGGGRFDGRLILTKSGGFGDTDLLVRLLSGNSAFGSP